MKKQEDSNKKLLETPKELLELWQFFAKRADSYKDKLWNITIWLYALLTGLLGYMASNFTAISIKEEVDAAGNSIPNPLITEPILMLVFVVFALLFCGYIILTIKEYGEHIQKNWNRANHILEKIDGLPEIWYPGFKQAEIEKEFAKNRIKMKRECWLNTLPPVPIKLIYLTFVMALIFLTIGGLSIWKLSR